MIKKYKKSFFWLLNSKLYTWSLLFIVIISYGYAATNISIGIDDLEGSRYLSVWPAEGRLGGVLANALFGIIPYHPLNSIAGDVIGLVLLMASITLICALFRVVSNDKISIVAYTVFACAVLSYPLINEIWEYSNCPINAGVGLFAAVLALMIINHEIESPKIRFQRIFFSVFFTYILCTSAESYVPIYIFLVFALLIIRLVYRTEEDITLVSIIKQGLWYASVLAVGVVLRAFITRLFIVLFQVTPMNIGDTSIKWLSGESFFTVLRDFVLDSVIDKLVLRSVVYYPILIFDIAVFVIIALGIGYATKNKSGIILLLVAGLLLSSISIPLLQGRLIGYRICSAFAYLVGFALLILIEYTRRIKETKLIKICVVVMSVFICVSQATYLNLLLTANSMRSKEEEFVLRNVGKDLYSEFDMGKPVIFTGQYSMSQEIEAIKYVDNSSVRYKAYCALEKLVLRKSFIPERLYYIGTNVSSAINWGLHAFGNQDSMHKLFSFYGIDYTPADYELVYEEAAAYVEENSIPGYPKEGYIVDNGDYIIVNFE